MREGQLIAEGPPYKVLVDAPMLDSCGIKQPPTVELFHSLGWPGEPITVEAATGLIQQHHLARRREGELTAIPSHPASGFPILEAEGLGYVYPTHHVEALRGVDLSIREGEFIAILGQNGSGKTTLAKHFNGLLKPTSGRILVRGKPTTEYSHRELAQLVGYVFQNPDHQIFAKTVREELGFGLKVFGENPNTIEKRVTEALEIVGLRGYEQRIPFTLTKGERQRVAVASVLAVQPQVIVLDEPTTGLDDRHQRNTMEVLKRLNKRGHTVIVITHSMWVAAEYADRTIVLKDGSILLEGPTRLIFGNEARLAEASLRPSPLLRLSNWLGTQALTVEQMVQELRGQGRS
jgi:energy-coupling factor transport system ATP-binding protein